MLDSERVKLLYGPYQVPRCRLGDKLICEYRDREMTVKGMTDAPISWPASRRGSRGSPIVCGDLVRAIQTESETAVAHHWGVQYPTVWKWRKALGVPRMTHGSTRLRLDWTDEIFSPDFRRRGREAMGREDVRAQMSATRKGRRPHPNSIEACRRLGQRPKSEAFKRAMSERSKKMWQNREAYGLPARRQWTEQELAMIGTDSDRAVAEALGLPINVVAYKRETMGISLLANRWKEHEIALIGTASDSELARRLGKSQTVVTRKRNQLGIPRFGVKPWTEAEITLLGTANDHEIARRIGRHPSCVYEKREELGIPSFIVRWTDAEVALLGSDTDRNIAKLLNRSEMAVRVRRKKAKIPAYC